METEIALAFDRMIAAAIQKVGEYYNYSDIPVGEIEEYYDIANDTFYFTIQQHKIIGRIFYFDGKAMPTVVIYPNIS